MGERVNGFYWIRFRDGLPEEEWQIAEWDGDDWWLVGCETSWHERELEVGERVTRKRDE
jgi:hypothetical protein